ncbi:unnamed protein product, partial [Phaeothamnion confervicola]
RASRKEEDNDQSLVEPHSGLRVRNRVLSGNDMFLRLKGRRLFKLADLPAAPRKVLEGSDLMDAWATLGVLTGRSEKRHASNGNPYASWRLSDLSGRESGVTLLVFRDALAAHSRVTEGTLLLLAGVGALPARSDGNGGGYFGGKGGAATTEKPSVCLKADQPWQLSSVGPCIDFGLCEGLRRDGR